MRIEVLAIGDELLDGRVADTNTVRLAQALSDVGLHLQQRTTVIDDIDEIIREARATAERGAQLCVVSGGLGPTTDDLTAEAFARLAGVPLVRDADQEAVIRRMLQRRNRDITPNQLKQADRPQGAEVIPNPVGSAPGFALVYKGCRFVSVPGVPREFDTLVANAVIAPLKGQNAPVLRRGLYCFGIPEGDADRKLRDLATRWPKVRLQYRVKMPEVHVTMHAAPENLAELDAAFAFAQAELGHHVFSNQELPFAAVVLQQLKAAGATVALAESCTGGLVGDLLTDIPGSSEVLQMGVIAYSNTAKVQQLSVQQATLDAHGAVSEATVREMASGVRNLAQTTYGLAVSGIAGPGGGTPDKPVGTIWLAVAGPQGVRTHMLSLPFERRNNKMVSAYSVLDMLRRML